MFFRKLSKMAMELMLPHGVTNMLFSLFFKFFFNQILFDLLTIRP